MQPAQPRSLPNNEGTGLSPHLAHAPSRDTHGAIDHTRRTRNFGVASSGRCGGSNAGLCSVAVVASRIGPREATSTPEAGRAAPGSGAVLEAMSSLQALEAVTRAQWRPDSAGSRSRSNGTSALDVALAPREAAAGADDDDHVQMLASQLASQVSVSPRGDAHACASMPLAPDERADWAGTALDAPASNRGVRAPPPPL